jgi:hypothetical protein
VSHLATPLTVLVAPDVALLRWPRDEIHRRRLAGQRLPRLLVVDRDEPPPHILDELEDWVRANADPLDVQARARTLVGRATELSAQPIMDPDGLLRVGERWVAIPATQVLVAELLVRRLDRLVRLEDLTEAYVRAGGSGKAASVKTVIARLGTRVREVGLDLVTVRGRGVVLAGPLPL